MCNTGYTEYGCGHDVPTCVEKCLTRKNSLYTTFPPCKTTTTERLRKDPGSCNTCTAKAANNGPSDISFWKKMFASKTCGLLLGPTAKISYHDTRMTSSEPNLLKPELDNQDVSTHRISMHGRDTFAAESKAKRVPNKLRKQRRIKTTPENAKATSGLKVGAIPGTVLEEEEPLRQSSNALHLHGGPLNVHTPVELPADVPLPPAELESLLAQQYAARADTFGITIPVKGLPQIPKISEIGSLEPGMRNSWNSSTTVDYQQKLKRKPLPPLPNAESSPTTGQTATVAQKLNRASTNRIPLPATAIELWGSARTPIAKNPLAAHPVAQAPKVVQSKNSRKDQQLADIFLAETAPPHKTESKTTTTLNGGWKKHDYDQAAEDFFEEEDDRKKLRSQTGNSLASEQHSELSLSIPQQVDLKTFAALESGNEGDGTPTLLRPGSRPDSSYKVSSVGEIPNWHETSPTASRKSQLPFAGKRNRNARLSTNEEQLWNQFVTSTYTSPNLGQAGPSEVQLPTPLKPASPNSMAQPKSKEEMRMSFRIDKPGAHDYYNATTDMNSMSSTRATSDKKAKGVELPATSSKTAAKEQVNRPKHAELPATSSKKAGKAQLGDTQSHEQASRLQEPYRAPKQTDTWEHIVVRACASIESMSSTCTSE